MVQLRATGKVREYYPDAICSREWIQMFVTYVKVHHDVCRENQIGFLTSICSDDLNSIGWPETTMIGPFVQGGLNGYPFAGTTGLGAFSHHIPDGGAALMFFGPHVGVTGAGVVGKVKRPGQDATTDCCGAAAAALKALEADEIRPLEPECFPPDDYQQETIRQIVLRHRETILDAGCQGGPERFMVMSEVIYQETKQAFRRMLLKTRFELPAFVFGGILINQDGGGESLIALRDLGRIKDGHYEDLTSDFVEKSEPRFRAYEAGNREALR